MKSKVLQSRLLYPARLSLRIDREKKSFPIEKYIYLKKFITTKTVLQEMLKGENQDGGIVRHTAPPRTTRTDRESNSKGDQHQENRK